MRRFFNLERSLVFGFLLVMIVVVIYALRTADDQNKTLALVDRDASRVSTAPAGFLDLSRSGDLPLSGESATLLDESAPDLDTEGPGDDPTADEAGLLDPLPIRPPDPGLGAGGAEDPVVSGADHSESGPAPTADVSKEPSREELPRYVVIEGDTITGIAGKLYDDRTMWVEIQNLNLHVRPWNLKAGKVLTLPREPLPGRLDPGTNIPAVTPTSRTVTRPAARSPSSASSVFQRTSSAETYVVKTGDTLTGIAREHYGTIAAWRLIRDGNRDLVSGEDRIIVGQVLKLPLRSPRG